MRLWETVHDMEHATVQLSALVFAAALAAGAVLVLKSENPSITTAETRPIGGLGILIVKKMSSRLAYRREGGRNVLDITLNLVRLDGV